MDEIVKYVKGHVSAFIWGAAPAGIFVGRIVFSIPPMLGVTGVILKLTTTVLFAAAGGLTTVLVTDLYKHYFKGWIFAQTDKIAIFIRKRLKNDRKGDKNKAA